MADERRQLFPPPPSHPSLKRDTPRNAYTPPPPARRVPPIPVAPTSESTPSSSVSHTPAAVASPLPPRTIPGSVENLLDVEYDDDASILETLAEEEEMTPEQLRQIYDEEEIDRFLNLFSAYVTEVNLSRTSSETPSPGPSESTVELVAEPSHDVDADEDHRTDTHGSDSYEHAHSERPDLGDGLAAWVASRLIPLLPPPQPPSPSFSIKRARLTANRLFLALEPTYYPILKRLWDLATWKEYGTSLFYCMLFWFLWYNGLLLAGLFTRLLYALLRRKFLPYPSASELRQYRREVELAESFSRKIIVHFVTSPAMNVKDAWDTFKEYRASKKKAKKDKDGVTVDEVSVEVETQTTSTSVPEIVVEEDPITKENMTEEEVIVTHLLEEEHLASPILHIANRIADIHERVKNIFMWRRPQVSSMYAMGLFILAVVTAVVPSKYVVKGATMAGGVFFWHVIPVLAALPPSDRERIPPPLMHSPTDAEYAMELISQRVALGLPVKPKRRKRASPFGSRLNLSSKDVVSDDGRVKIVKSNEVVADMKTWGERVVQTKAWAGDVKSIFREGKWKSLDTWASANQLKPQGSSYRSSERTVETHTYLAQRKGPGLITLTDALLYFTSLTASTPELTIKLDDVASVKKSGVARGLKIRVAATGPNGVQEEREERFLWVADRDDLFARLASWHGRD